MKLLFRLVLLCLISSVSYAQNIYQIRADSVRIYSGCDTAELIIENHTQDTLGFLFNKGKGRTEFRKLRLKMVGNSLAIVGQDTVQLGGAGGSGYIQNQFDSVQKANFSIDGVGKSGKGFISNAGQETPHYSLKVNNTNRWGIGVINAEPGSGIDGSDLGIYRYNDFGTLRETPLIIKRRTGLVDMPFGFISGPQCTIRGSGSGQENIAYLWFTETNGVNAAGYIGKSSGFNHDLTFQSAKGNIALSAYSAQDPQFSLGPKNLTLKMGTLNLSDTTVNSIVYSSYGVGAPAFVFRSKGTKIALSSNINSTNVDHGIGIEQGYTWFSVPQNINTLGWKFYGGVTPIGRIDGKGGADWEGMSRFKGDYSSGAGPAAEVGFSSGQAQLRGYDRTTTMYTTISVTGGSTVNDPKSFAIDGTGYRFNMLANAGMLGTDANGYLVSKSVSLSNILAAGNQTGNNPIVFNRPLAGDNMLFDLQQGYALYSDNLASMDGRPGKRLWINTPDSGDVVLGPRAFAYLGGVLRIRMRDIKLEGSNGKYVNYSVLGTDANGYLVNNSANFVQAQGATPQAISFNISGSGIAKSIATGANIGNEDIVIYKSSHPDSLATNKRWVFYKSGTETGGNAGSNFVISRYNDNGVFQDNPLQIARVNGDVIFSATPKVGTNRDPLWVQTNHPAGNTVTVGFPGATVLDSFFTNSAGHVTQVKTRTLKASDISAAPSNITLSAILNNGNTAQKTIALGAAGNDTQYVFQSTRYIGGINATASLGVSNTGTNVGGLYLSTTDGTPARSKIFYLNNTDAAPLYSPDNGTNKYTVWHSNNHVAGKLLTPTLTGANVLASLVTNDAGHVTAATTRTLTPADIAAAPATGSASYIQNQSASAQTGSFNLNGAGVLGGNLTVGGNEVVTGTVTATGFNQSSLRALKMNIKDCELNALRIIDSIKVREFEYKKAPGRKVIGIIADDEPAIISGEKHDHLDMMNAVGLLLKSVQELNARLEKLEQKVNQEQSSK